MYEYERREGVEPAADPMTPQPPYAQGPYGERPYDQRVVREERWVGTPNRWPVQETVVEPPYNYTAVRVAWFVVALISTLIGIRFVLKMLGASPSAEFVGFVYGITSPLVAPFRGIFADNGSGFYIFEASSLVAIAIYLLLGWGIVNLIKIVTAPRRRPVL